MEPLAHAYPQVFHSLHQQEWHQSQHAWRQGSACVLHPHPRTNMVISMKKLCIKAEICQTHSTALVANNRTYSKYLKDDKTYKRLYILSRHTTLMQCLVHCTTRCFVTLCTLHANQQATTCLKGLYPVAFVYLPYCNGSILPRTGCVLTVTCKRVHV